jgi:hypothetical protein
MNDSREELKSHISFQAETRHVTRDDVNPKNHMILKGTNRAVHICSQLSVHGAKILLLSATNLSLE